MIKVSVAVVDGATMWTEKVSKSVEHDTNNFTTQPHKGQVNKASSHARL